VTSAESINALLKEIRTLRVVVIHPVDQDGEELVAQLRRIGCAHESHWPALDALPVGTDLVLLAVRPETLSIRYPWLGKPSTPPVIPVVAFENPITLAAVLQLDAFSTVASPVRSAGLLTAIALTLHQSKLKRSRERYIDRLEQKSAHQRVIQQATAILMDHRGLPESDAYQLLRSQAMLKRENIEVVARDIVKARDTLNL
jgi:AmiR/NasT family two-component response regulator